MKFSFFNKLNTIAVLKDYNILNMIGGKIHRVHGRRFKKNKIQSLIREDPCQGSRLMAPRRSIQ